MTSRWLSTTLRTVTVCAALAGCGGSLSDQDDLNVVVKVNGVQVAGPLHADATQPITVASGDQVVFESATEVSYSLGMTQVEAPDSSHDDRSYQAKLTSVVGGSAQMMVTSGVDASDRLTVKLIVQPQAFVNRTWSVGETLIQDYIYRVETERYTRHVTAVHDLGSYSIETDVNAWGRYTDSYDADSNHTYFRFDDLSGSDYPEDSWCSESPGLLIKSFPLFVGKQWDSEWDSECVFEETWHHMARNRVVGYETVTVPAGTFQVLHIVSDQSIRYPSGELKFPTRTECWWSVDFQQDVKCDDWEITNGVPSELNQSVQAVQLAGQAAAASGAATPNRTALHKR